VAEQESGLAAGLVDSSFNIGGALGIAILSAVAVASTDETLTGRDAQLRAITAGYQTAFAVAVGLALAGLLVALLLLGRTSPSAEPADAIGAASP
jgi:hypothetical protein